MAAEFGAKRLAHFEHGKRWGLWVLDTKDWYLSACRPGEGPETAFYEVPLSDFTDGRAILRWLAHLQDKPWAAPEIGNFVAALIYLFGPWSHGDDGPRTPSLDPIAYLGAAR